MTAVRLTHTGGGWIDLDPRALQGDFLTATFQHPTLVAAVRIQCIERQGETFETLALAHLGFEHLAQKAAAPEGPGLSAGSRSDRWC